MSNEQVSRCESPHRFVLGLEPRVQRASPLLIGQHARVGPRCCLSLEWDEFIRWSVGPDKDDGEELEGDPVDRSCVVHRNEFPLPHHIPMNPKPG